MKGPRLATCAVTPTGSDWPFHYPAILRLSDRVSTSERETLTHWEATWLHSIFELKEGIGGVGGGGVGGVGVLGVELGLDQVGYVGCSVVN